MQYSDDFKQKVKEFYFNKAKELYKKGKNKVAIARQAGTATKDEFGDVGNSSIKRWTQKFRDEQGHFDFRFFEDIDRADNDPEDNEDRGYDHTYHTKPYIYTGEKYYIPVSRREEPLELSEDEYKKIRVWYSNWTGDKDSVNQICRKLGMSRSLFLEIKDKLGFTHDSPPATDEEITEKSEEELLNDFLKQREGELERKYQREVWKETEKEAKKWREFKNDKLDPLKKHFEKDIESYEVPEIQIAESDTNHAYAVLLNDVHVGATANKEESGEEFNLKICKNRNLKLAARLLSKFNRFGNPEKIYVVVGGDFFHIDKTMQNTNNAQTTYGTVLDTSEHPKKIIATGFELARDFIDVLRQIGVPVEVIVVQGNHDKLLSYTLSEYLKLWEQYQDDVIVNSVLKSRYYTKYHNNLIAVAHGKKENKSDLGKIMPREAPQLWAETNSRYYITGHKHSLRIDDSDPSGVTLVRSSAPAPVDRYHKEQGFIGATKAINSFVFYEDGGLPDNINASVSV